MADKFIPNGDEGFFQRAQSFARTIAKDPTRYAVSDVDAQALSTAAERFAASYMASRTGERSTTKIAIKERDRCEAEKIVRRVANAIRANEAIDAVDKVRLGMKPRVRKPKVLTVPNESPKLIFVRAIHEGNAAAPEHELKFSSRDYKPKPAGAVRLELFVDLIPPDAEVPTHPALTRTGRPMYLRSFTRSPIRLIPPVANVPMQVVYWARWADTAGNVGPFSETVIGWIEGGALMARIASLPHSRMKPIEVTIGEAVSEPESVIVALQTAGRFGASGPALLETTERRQLEGPAEAA